MDEVGSAPPSIPDSPPSTPDVSSQPDVSSTPDTSATPATPATSTPDTGVQADLQKDSFTPAGTDGVKTDAPVDAKADAKAQEQIDAQRIAGENAAAALQRSALAGAQGTSGFDGGPSAASPTSSTTPRKEIDMTPKVYGSPEYGPGYTVKESESSREIRTDGKIQGGDGKIYEPEKGKGIDGIPPTQPNDPNKVTNKDPVLSIYGIDTDAATAAQNNKDLANAVNRPVVSVRNATEGFLPDSTETVWDQKAHNAPIPSTKTAADIITDRLANNQPLEIHAHSQGAVVASQAIEQARNQLINEKGLTPQQADERLKLLTVNTYGGASAAYPNGPQYTHNINRLDPVASGLGLGGTGLDWGTRPGTGATINRETHPALSVTGLHGFTNYLNWFHPPAQRVQQ